MYMITNDLFIYFFSMQVYTVDTRDINPLRIIINMIEECRTNFVNRVFTPVVGIELVHIKKNKKKKKIIDYGKRYIYMNGY